MHDVGLSENASRRLTLLSRGLGLQGMRSAVATEKELGVATDNGLDQGISVGWLLRNGFAEGERIATGLVRSEVEVMSGDGSYENGQG